MFYGFALWFQYDTDFFILDKFPLSVRPFYTMPDPENEVSLVRDQPFSKISPPESRGDDFIFHILANSVMAHSIKFEERDVALW